MILSNNIAGKWTLYEGDMTFRMGQDFTCWEAVAKNLIHFRPIGKDKWLTPFF